MKRRIIESLEKWLYKTEKKPLILRGARQVGKTWAVRELAETSGYDLIEINFERNPELGDLFLNKNPVQIMEQLSVLKGKKYPAEKTILFLDEIQACSRIIANLRWFYEEMPELSVIAAGSLLEFTLEDHDFSMPVGRVTYMFMEPMSFVEFLWATGEELLADTLEKSFHSFEISDLIHQKVLSLFQEYCIIGGMPAVVKLWAETHVISDCMELQQDLIMTIRDDFNKYRKKIEPEIMRHTMESGPRQLGGKFVYSHIDKDARQAVVKEAAKMLCNARIFRKICHTAANGIPLGAEIKDNIFKIFLLDTGLAVKMLGLKPFELKNIDELVWSNKGAIAEQVVTQLIFSGSIPKSEEVYFWQQSGSGNGEIDLIISKDGVILPIEIKAGVSGSMKSLHAFMETKGLKTAYRFDTNKPSRQFLDLKTNAGKNVKYELVSYPLYMAEFLTLEKQA